MTFTVLSEKIEKCLIEQMNETAKHKNLKKNLYTEWDSKMKLSFPNLIIPPLFGKGSQDVVINPRLNVKWEPPEQGWYKINFDGASAGNPSPSGIGCIVRDSKGKCLKEIAENIGVETNNEVEFRAAYQSLQLGTDLGWRNIHLEGDSLNVINAIQNKQTPSWHLNRWLRPILALLERLDDF
ncbi:uncharacterized protein LOC131044456 [Cryptomeria japonica]|uniref:uncharacterized protein LOC131044456 n=1 Tax=Cryptomeria japonica TaxID=3369 RepID=UPI0027DA0410|nr:uncharacterized protein LOC131044456 [Cryptomeria japonica]